MSVPPNEGEKYANPSDEYLPYLLPAAARTHSRPRPLLFRRVRPNNRPENENENENEKQRHVSSTDKAKVR